jgi:hypothetical protein
MDLAILRPLGSTRLLNQGFCGVLGWNQGLGDGVNTYRLFVKKVNGIEEKKSGSITLTR